MPEPKLAELMICPHCSATIEYDGKGEATVKCPYCGGAVGVPPQYLAKAAPQPAPDKDLPEMRIEPGYYILAFVLIVACILLYYLFIVRAVH